MTVPTATAAINGQDGGQDGHHASITPTAPNVDPREMPLDMAKSGSIVMLAPARFPLTIWEPGARAESRVNRCYNQAEAPPEMSIRTSLSRLAGVAMIAASLPLGCTEPAAAQGAVRIPYGNAQSQFGELWLPQSS